MIERQITEQKEELTRTTSNFKEGLNSLRGMLTDLKFSAVEVVLDRLRKKFDIELERKQHRKLCDLYGGNIHLKEVKDSFVNLSKANISDELVQILSLGFNFHTHSKLDPLHRKVQVEKLFEDIKIKEKNNLIKIHDESLLKTELERFGSKLLHGCKDPITKTQRDAIKNFTRNENIVVRKADKRGIFVFLDKDVYTRKVDEILCDNTKFEKINSDPTDDLKKKLNSLISDIKRAHPTFPMHKLNGHYDPGYIYANPKIHKTLIDPPFRPIISQIGTVTYELSKQLNSIIVKYLPKRFQADSTYEFLTVLKECPKIDMLASLDVENLFSNVPVANTIDLILQNTYDHEELAPPPIPRGTMKELLLICTTKTPFRNINGDLYIQREGVSMGNPLGPTFANYYMCNLENSIFDNYCEKPQLYIRYVDDICIGVAKFDQILKLKNLFESHSVLKFTFETEICKKLPFLDVLLNRRSNQICTSVYTKPTNPGECLNYDSSCPERYKVSVVNSLLYRSYKLCSSWDSFHCEVLRVKQLLTNNNFPMSVIDKSINKFLNKIMNNNNSVTNVNSIKFYFHNQMSANYKQDESQLKSIISKNILPCNQENEISLSIFYRARKLNNLFIKNNVHTSNDSVVNRHHVVYQYTCPRDGCNSTQSYIGHTTCTIANRFKMHTQNCSSIKKHLLQHHKISKISSAELTKDVTVLKSCPDKRDLTIYEAILIKMKRPTLNSQTEFSDKLLKIFKH